ncbi:transposase domain-containing protein [Kitasatospora sp. NPDC059571]|uniref:transposase domain-containing protein n=1 Tax=Kitasatospora sp. NPDC059571 TaxID=3346871 RepID=UPI0036B816AE
MSTKTSCPWSRVVPLFCSIARIDGALAGRHPGRSAVRCWALGRPDAVPAVRTGGRRPGGARTVRRRQRDPPSRVVVYFLVAMCSFPEVGYRLVWDKMTAGLVGFLPAPSAKGLRDCGAGWASPRSLFEVVSGALAQPRTPGVRFGPDRTVCFDGSGSIKTSGPRTQSGLAGTVPARRPPADRADDAGRDRDPLGDRCGLRPHQEGRDRLRHPAAEAPGTRHAGAVGPGLRRQRLPSWAASAGGVAHQS